MLTGFSRFHAWQSALLFSFMFVVHVVFSWSTVVSWMLFVLDLATIGYLTMRAYRDGKDALLTCWTWIWLTFDSGNAGSVRGTVFRLVGKLHPR